ncbi:MAG: glycerol kinase GlpK [Pseudorhodobacter sp.]|nr:MAG: glycerol kinase GlpK [Pseudorhodobacter sp.]
MPAILALDQGTTSSRAILFDGVFRPLATAQREFTQHYPRPGWVEHEAADLWQATLDCARQVIEKTGKNPDAIGITNQRETTVLWDRATGRPLHRAIVWQDRRTADICARLKAEGHEPMVTAKTGLLLDPYFSGTKLAWLLDNVPGARARAEAGELAFGTVDSWLIWNLTGGRVHATDATNAARTMLFNIGTNGWDDELCSLLRVPLSLLPEVKDCAADFGCTAPGLFAREIPIAGVAGDQQAATIGQGCFQPGMTKSTYGTGCFALMNTGAARLTSTHRLLTTIAYRLGGKTTYALEGSIFVAGAVVQWLRDGLQIVGHAEETQGLAEASDPASSVIIVPAFTGMGAPYWRAEAQGAIFGLTRGTGRAEMARAALESVGFQTVDLMRAMQGDGGDATGAVLRVDGGMARSDWAMQFLADILGVPVDRPVVTETTALGAACLAALQVGMLGSLDEFATSWALERRFTPAMPEPERAARVARWQRAVQATLSV